MLRNPTPKSFREEVRRRADSAGKTRQEAADKFGVARQTIYGWLGSGDLSISALAKLAKGSGEAIVLRFDPNPEDIEEQAPRPEWAEGLATKADIDAMIETLIPVVLDRVWEQSRPELLRQLRDALTRDNGGSSQ